MRCCDKEICSREFAFDLLGWDRAAERGGESFRTPTGTMIECHIVEDPRTVPAPLS